MHKLLLITTLLALAACARAPCVVVAGEALTGKYVEDGQIAAFLGVPFAEPPVGDRRWRAPQPLTTTVAQRDVTAFAPACMQSMRILDWYRSMAVLFGGTEDYYDDLEISEDCLYLNIWTSTLTADANLPVMVWIHGGSNKSGWSYEPNYYGHKLAQKGVVIVSVAYRQGAFGFLSHPDMPDDEPLANFALWDLIASLRWVQDNIDKFGGDPDRVTLFGESSGAQNILALMFARPADDLFDRGVAQSTAGFGLTRMSTLADEQQRGVELAEALGLPVEGSLAAMREVPAEEVFAVYDSTFSDYYHSPAVDGQLLTERIWTSIHERGFGERQMIIGSNSHEWYSYTATDTTWDDVERQVAELFDDVDHERALAAVRKDADPRRALDRLLAAESMLCPSQHVAATMSAAGADAWMYYFTRVRQDGAGASLGAYHGAEYPYVFGTHDEYMTTDATDLELQQAMQSYWVRFATTGNPNSADTPDWPRFAGPSPVVQELGDEVLTRPAPETELCAVLRASAQYRRP